MTNQPEPADTRNDVWASGQQYEAYVGRWSRPVARQFVEWLQVAPDGRWLDVGCGTGALAQTILDQAQPRTVQGIEPSAGFLAVARRQVADPRARFDQGDARALPVDDAACDAVVAGLVINFVPDPAQAVAEMRRSARPGGVVAAYVWDYGGKMQFMRHFWNAAAALDPAAAALDEGRRFPLCRPEPLAALWQRAGLSAVATTAIDIATDFTNFDDYWAPFLGGQGPAPGYAMALTAERRAALRERLRAALPTAVDGAVPLTARAWAVRGQVV